MREFKQDEFDLERARAFRLFLFGYDFAYAPMLVYALLFVTNSKEKPPTLVVALLAGLCLVLALVNLGAAARRWWAPLLALPQAALAAWLCLIVSGVALAKISAGSAMVPVILLAAQVVVLLLAVHALRVVSNTYAPPAPTVDRGTVVPLSSALVSVLARVASTGGSLTEESLQQAAQVVKEFAGPGVYQQTLMHDLNARAVDFDKKAYARACNSLRHDLGFRRRNDLLKRIAELAEAIAPPELAFEIVESLRAELEPERN